MIKKFLFILSGKIKLSTTTTTTTTGLINTLISNYSVSYMSILIKIKETKNKNNHWLPFQQRHIYYLKYKIKKKGTNLSY